MKRRSDNLSGSTRPLGEPFGLPEFSVGSADARIPSRIDLIGRSFRKLLIGWGRASRREYWSIFFLALAYCAGAIYLEFNVINPASSDVSGFFTGALIIAVLVFLPALFFAGMRRYHDIGRSGWLYALHMFSGFGTAFAVFAMLAKSEPIENKHGPVPPEARR